MTVAAATFVMGQADKLLWHESLTYSSLILAPGCLLPLFLWWGLRYWSAALCGAMLTLLFMSGIRTVAVQSPWISVPAIAAGLAVEMGLTVWLLRRWNFRTDLSRGKDALLLVYAACLGTVVSGWVVMPVVYWPEALSLTAFLQACGTWWLMHFVSMIVFAPCWLIWKRWRSTAPREWWVLAALLGGLAILESIGFRLWSPVQTLAAPMFYASFPLVIWGVLRHGMRAASLIVIATSLIAGHATASGIGPFVHADPILSNLQLNLYLLSIGLTFNLVGCFAEESYDSVERLKIDHALLAKAEEIAGVGSWQVDALTRTERWSQQFYRLLGLMPDEIPADIESFGARFVVPEDRALLRESWDSFVKTGQPDLIELRIRRTDGRERILEGQAEVQRDQRGRPVRFVGTLRDVTERKQALEDRQRVQDMLNKAQEMANLGSWVMDGTGDMPRWSENMYRICGVEVGDFDGTFETFLERFVHPDDRPTLWQSFLDFARGTGADWAEFRIVHGDGTIHDVRSDVQVASRENGQLIRCYGTTTDITERKQAERKLKDSELRYRLLADHASDMIARIRDDGTVAYVSPACRKILGFEPAEMTDRLWTDFLAMDDRSFGRQTIQRLLSGENPAAAPFRGQRKDGSVVWLESRSQLLIGDAGGRELICVTRDITQRRLLEEQVAQAQRLEAIGRLAGGIAHDFNNILTVINGYAEILEMRFPAGDPAAKHVASILEAGQRAAQLTRQLLTYSRKELVTRGLINLNELIQKLTPLLPPLMGETIELSIRLESEPALFDGASSQIEQLIMNLVINARDAMPDGGVLTLETSNVRMEPGEARPVPLSPGTYLKFVVADTGEGMNETVKARVFEPFFTTKRVGEGTGLGLPTVYATVEQCRGGITVDSALGEGTRFELFFPAHTGVKPVAPFPPPTRDRSPAPADERRILVVEDDGDVRSLVEFTLSQAKYRVVAVSNGEQALKLVDGDSQAFDLLLTDVVMKGVNGRELADCLHERFPKLPVIFMSGHTEDEIVRRGVLHDELTFLQKPFSAEELMTRVQQVLARQAV